ncbi:protein LDOC1-like [Myxocyprinus asiaticus]|uniref:protein LDOC1-like n=1 Tax=Myxocyprinus asiaticus TaxID=70543 RepID=UPI0022215435|nr:protein LDOC1-like [Myxocyprinus asiaticus]
MDPAEKTTVRSALSQQGALLGRHQVQISASNCAMEKMASQLTEFTTLVQQLHLSPDPSLAQDLPSHPSTFSHASANRSDVRILPPAPYSGEGSVRAFLSHCSLFFSMQSSTFTSDTMKIACVITLLSGKAGDWGTAMWDNRHACCSSYEAFSTELRRVFRSHRSGPGGRESVV